MTLKQLPQTLLLNSIRQLSWTTIQQPVAPAAPDLEVAPSLVPKSILTSFTVISFLDNDTTGADESRFAVKDFFTATANKDKGGAAKSGGVQVEAATGVTGKFELGDGNRKGRI